MKRKMLCSVCIAGAIALSGCSFFEKDTSHEIVINDAKDIKEKDVSFNDPFVEGQLIYELEDCNIYDNLSDAKISVDDMMDPHNVFYDQEMGEKYQTVNDYIESDGKIKNQFKLVVLDMEIENKNAVGMIKKNEFNVANFALRGGENVSQYNISYFDKASILDPERPLYYNLEQGKSIDVKIGYFVKEDDIENMVGVISDSDVQFFLR